MFRLGSPSDYEPDFEVWRFAPGATVRCEMTVLEDGEYLVAVESLRLG